MKRIPFSSRSSQQGVVIIEVMVAILLFAVGVLAVAGLQASMITNTSDSIFRAQANYLAQQTIGQMWADPTNILNYVTVTNTQDLPNGTITVTAPAPPAPPNLYQIVIQWQQPGQAQHTFTTFATIIAP